MHVSFLTKIIAKHTSSERHPIARAVARYISCGDRRFCKDDLWWDRRNHAIEKLYSRREIQISVEPLPFTFSVILYCNKNMRASRAESIAINLSSTNVLD